MVPADADGLSRLTASSISVAATVAPSVRIVPATAVARARVSGVRAVRSAADGDSLGGRSRTVVCGVTLWTDGGGKVRQAMRPVTGSDKVAAWFAGISRQPYQGIDFADMSADLHEINGAVGLVFSGAGRVIATVTIDLDNDGRIVTIHNVANPDKLQAVVDGTMHDISGR